MVDTKAYSKKRKERKNYYMLKEYLEKQEDYVLWQLLADIGSVLGSRTHKNPTSEFWQQLAKEVQSEIDTRLFNDYEKDGESI